MNQRSSAMTARRKTRLVVRRGRMRVCEGEGEGEGEVDVGSVVVAVLGVESVKRSCVGAKMEYVPVPVLGIEIVF